MVSKLWRLLLSPHYSLQYICVTSEVNAIPPFTQIEIAKKEAKQKVILMLVTYLQKIHLIWEFEIKPSCFWVLRLNSTWTEKHHSDIWSNTLALVLLHLWIFDVIDILLNFIVKCWIWTQLSENNHLKGVFGRWKYEKNRIYTMDFSGFYLFGIKIM